MVKGNLNLEVKTIHEALGGLESQDSPQCYDYK